MRDNLRRSRAIRDAVTQGSPGQRNGHAARPLTTLAARISGIVGSKRTQLPHIATQVPNGRKFNAMAPFSRKKVYGGEGTTDLGRMDAEYTPKLKPH